MIEQAATGDGRDRGVAIVTGGGTGIGRATACRLVLDGFRVHAVGLDCDPDLPEAVTFTKLDVADTAAIEELVAPIERLTALVNCAGIIRQQREWEADTFSQVLDINLRAAFSAAQVVKPKLLETGGSVVNVASMWSFFGSANAPAYAASKSAIVSITRSMAVNWGPQGVRVNAVAPGWVDTRLGAGAKADPVRGPAILARIPMGRWAAPEEVASVVSFLVSPDASYINGSVIAVDGGYSIA